MLIELLKKPVQSVIDKTNKQKQYKEYQKEKSVLHGFRSCPDKMSKRTNKVHIPKRHPAVTLSPLRMPLRQNS